METTIDDRTGQWGQQFRAAGGQALQLQSISEQKQASGTRISQWVSLSIPEIKITRHVREDQRPTKVMETEIDHRTGQGDPQSRAAAGQALQLQSISEQRQASGTHGSQRMSLSIPELKITRHVREDQRPTEVIETEIDHRTGQWDLQSRAAGGQALQLQTISEQRPTSGTDGFQWVRLSIPAEVKITGHVREDLLPTRIAPKGFQAHKHLISFAGRFQCAIAKRLSAFVGSL